MNEDFACAARSREIVVNLYFLLKNFTASGRTQNLEQLNLHPLELGLDAPELFDEQVAVVLRVEVAEILADGVQADDAELTPEKRNTTMRHHQILMEP